MTRVRALMAGGVLLVVVLVVAVIAASSGSSDGPRAFVVGDASSALLIEWTRVHDDVSGSMTRAQLAAPAAGLFADARVAGEAARDVKRESRPFTGTISGASVRLSFTDGGALGARVNGKLDGDALTFTLTGNGPPTLRLKSGTRADFETAVRRIQVSEKRRAGAKATTREEADATARSAIKRVAVAYEKALDPTSPDDPCRYMSAAARSAVVADPAAGAPAGGCEAIVRFYERGAGAGPPHSLGAATIELRTLVNVPAENLADGAEVRFAGLPNEPIGLVRDGGQWRIAEYR